MRVGYFSLLFLLASIGLLHAGEFQEVHRCDEQAAHPLDPNRWAEGVLDEDIIPGPAITFCQRAVDENPDTPRFLFQLGRALWAGQRFEEGLQQFKLLEETYNYAPVYAYLGDAYMHGIGGVEIDQELAVSLYQIAADGGFTPAGDVLAALATPDTAENQQAEVPQKTSNISEPEGTQLNARGNIPRFDPKKFGKPEIVSALNSGNIGELRKLESVQMAYSGIGVPMLPIYLNSFSGEFEGTYNYKDPNCVYLYNPRVTNVLKQNYLDSLNGAGMSMGNNLAMGLSMLLGSMRDLEQTGGRGLAQQEFDITTLKQSGEQDAGKLINAYGCDSEVVRRVYHNLEAYALGESVEYSPEEKSRLQEEQRLRAIAAEKQRQATFRTNASASCEKRFKKAAFCSCLVSSLNEAGLSDANWSELGQDFGAVLTFAKDTPGFAEKLKSCRSQG